MEILPLPFISLDQMCPFHHQRLLVDSHPEIASDVAPTLHSFNPASIDSSSSSSVSDACSPSHTAQFRSSSNAFLCPSRPHPIQPSQTYPSLRIGTSVVEGQSPTSTSTPSRNSTDSSAPLHSLGIWQCLRAYATVSTEGISDSHLFGHPLVLSSSSSPPLIGSPAFLNNFMLFSALTTLLEENDECLVCTSSVTASPFLSFPPSHSEVEQNQFSYTRYFLLYPSQQTGKIMIKNLACAEQLLVDEDDRSFLQKDEFDTQPEEGPTERQFQHKSHSPLNHSKNRMQSENPSNPTSSLSSSSSEASEASSADFSNSLSELSLTDESAEAKRVVAEMLQNIPHLPRFFPSRHSCHISSSLSVLLAQKENDDRLHRTEEPSAAVAMATNNTAHFTRLQVQRQQQQKMIQQHSHKRDSSPSPSSPSPSPSISPLSASSSSASYAAPFQNLHPTEEFEDIETEDEDNTEHSLFGGDRISKQSKAKGIQPQPKRASASQMRKRRAEDNSLQEEDSTILFSVQPLLKKSESKRKERQTRTEAKVAKRTSLQFSENLSPPLPSTKNLLSSNVKHRPAPKPKSNPKRHQFLRIETPKTWESLDDKKVKCLCCSHRCIITPGRAGICGVRKNVDGSIVSMVFGRAIAHHTDPIEKKPLHHFLPGTPIYSIGTIGCNFKCDFCQNWDISQVDQIAGSACRTGDIEDSLLGIKLSPEQIAQHCIESRSPSVAFTYNEPTIFMDYAMATAALVKPHGIKTVFVTNGYETPEAVDMLAGLIDAFNVDVKAFTDEFYKKHCKSSIAPVLATVERAKKAGIWVETTTLLIPGENDSDEELDALTKWLVSVDPSIPWHISAFHPEFKMMDTPRTPLSTLERAYRIGKKNGVNFIYMGNVGSSGKSNTECPKCGSVLVRRIGMMNTTVDKSKFDVETGKCKSCGTEIPGIWK
ncbi:putative Radical SAM protein [Monocercomonoides exilis]|uniref:putative Radical SAM protein n=1 Tax=Monocercomonoides exilis TaxID=2049356 RepID=UPI00355A20E5|nr:putative Radical SAM protein [Monocercomonoides exilis]|eukprot:MONOS_994.1-p1 / transcript=MONOS_994.1 / gene=MONOS_994 / organism=Monocercomonoides_exilis_PA203 / gene_product=Radical SAM protein / transcript_product=Radical SAM protein / location=Mono_scaffold00016:202262-205912(-) / protein_length=934 / sequence_SO=supercontig / SO=protein_coding / is_pseudo=false